MLLNQTSLAKAVNMNVITVAEKIFAKMMVFVPIYQEDTNAIVKKVGHLLSLTLSACYLTLRIFVDMFNY